MIKHNFIDILKTLSEEELISFYKYLKSPFFNNSDKLTEVYAEIYNHRKNFNTTELTRQKLLKKVSKAQTYNENTFRVIMHKLLQNLYKYFAVRYLNERELYNKGIVLEELITRKMRKLIPNEIKKTNKDFDNYLLDYNFLHDRYLYESHIYNYLHEYSSLSKKDEIYSLINQTNNADKYLLLYFISELINSYIISIILVYKYNINKEQLLSVKIIDSFKLKNLLDLFEKNEVEYRIINLYVLCYGLFENNKSRSNYTKYKRELKKFNNNLSAHEKSFHYKNLINYCILRNNSGISYFFINELFDLYEYYLKCELFKNHPDDNIPPDLYRDIAINAIQNKKYDWFENFANNYAYKLHPSLRDSMYYLCYSIYYNSLGKYQDALDSVEKIKSDKIIFKYDKYIIMLMIYFNYEDPEKALNLIHTFKKFIRKDSQLSMKRKIPYRLFYQYIFDIVNYKENKKNYDIEYIKNLLMNDNVVLYKKWLIKQTELAEKEISSEKLKSGKNISGY